MFLSLGPALHPHPNPLSLQNPQVQRPACCQLKFWVLCRGGGFIIFFLMRLYPGSTTAHSEVQYAEGCSCGSRGFLEDQMIYIITGRAPLTSSTSRVTSLQGQSRARTAWAISVRTLGCSTVVLRLFYGCSYMFGCVLRTGPFPWPSDP